MHKLSAANVKDVLLQAAADLRKSAAELAYKNEQLEKAETQLAEHELDSRLHRLASEMDDKGLSSVTVEEKVAELRRPENLAQLPVLEAAVGMAAGGVKLAHLESTDAHGVSGTANEAEARFMASLAGLEN